MGERSATHHVYHVANTSMGNAALTHPKICPLSEKAVDLIKRPI
jgi:hypothetical protein